MFSYEYCKKSLRTPILKKICKQLLLILWKRIDTAEDQTTQAKNFKINANMWVLNFLNWFFYKQKFKENVCKSKQVQDGKLPWQQNLIFTCNHEVTSVLAGRTDISSWQIKIR